MYNYTFHNYSLCFRLANIFVALEIIHDVHKDLLAKMQDGLNICPIG